MPLIIVRNDITTMRVDAIVNAANESLLGGGGVDGCIHRAAGRSCWLNAGDSAGAGPARPSSRGDTACPANISFTPSARCGTAAITANRSSSFPATGRALALARKHHCQTVAFPLISSGVYGYPKEQALRTAMDAIGAFLLEHDMRVYLVIFDRSAYQISSRLFADIAAYIDDHYVDAHTDFIRSRPYSDSITDEDVRPTCRAPSAAFPSVPRPLRSLDDRLKHLDAGFSETLLTRIDRSGKKDSEIYKRANVDRKLFSKIRSNPDYRPSKPTALAFAIALELDLNETRDLIARAGYALSRSSKFDVIIEYFISQRNYNIYEINEALFAFDQSLLGA